MKQTNGVVALCKISRCRNPVAKRGRICDACYLKVAGGRKSCPRCKAIIHIKQRECARHMLEAKGGITRRPRESISNSLRKRVYERDLYTCQLCGAVGTGTTYREKIQGFEIDHIKPNAAGGGATIENLQVLCRACNNSKRHYRIK